MPPIDGRIKELIPEKPGEYGYAVLDLKVILDDMHLLLNVDPRMKSRLPSLGTRSCFISRSGQVVKHSTNSPMIVRKAFNYRIYPNQVEL